MSSNGRHYFQEKSRTFQARSKPYINFTKPCFLQFQRQNRNPKIRLCTIILITLSSYRYTLWRMAGKGEGPAIGIDLGTTYSCVGVWQHDRVEIIANDQGNRTTPSYVGFTDTERLIGDAAKNQVAMNPTNTVFGIFSNKLFLYITLHVYVWIIYVSI